MNRRSLLKTSLIPLTTMVAGCSMPFVSPSRTTPHLFMSFTEATPADKPLVVNGLGEDGSTNDVWGQLFTQPPQSPVFSDRIDEISPYMKSQLNAARYDERFIVLAQMRFPTPQILNAAIPHQIEWIESNRLRVVLEPQSLEDPSEELRNANSIVATILLIFKYDTKPPESVILPVQTEGKTMTKIVAQ